MPQWTLDDMIPMEGKTAVITGANTGITLSCPSLLVYTHCNDYLVGIGYVACKALLQNGAKTYMMSRDSQKSREAIERMKQETGKDAVELIPIDLSDLHSVRKAAEMFLSKESRLDVLMNNAGVMMTPTKDLTKDGYDLQFGVNVLAHFHLTSLLLPALLAVPSPRIINLSSEMHRRGPKNGIEWDTLKGPKKRSWFPVLDTMASIKLYSQSKLGNILHANEISRRYSDRGLVAISVHPGVIASELSRNLDFISRRFLTATAGSTSTGALTQLYAANSPEAQKLSGKYLVPIARVEEPLAIANDQELAKKMWDWCENELKSF
ncbi:hypothetical protein FRC15_005319 [Serendipita sp. 397]|nr:hypothetical protein FRC15_005319 [Serendipita sp. 397]